MTKESILYDLREISRMNSGSSYKHMACSMAADLIENQAQALDALTLANMALREKAEKYRWIPVEEALPTPFESVLGYMPEDKPLPTVHECYTDNGGNFHGLSFYGNPKITHWMPMPEFGEVK